MVCTKHYVLSIFYRKTGKNDRGMGNLCSAFITLIGLAAVLSKYLKNDIKIIMFPIVLYITSPDTRGEFSQFDKSAR